VVCGIKEITITMDATKSSSPKSSSRIQKMKETIEQTLPINKIPRPINNNNSTKTSNSWHISNTPSSIQNQQQLLILLFHARTCSHDHDCSVAGPQCIEAKRMWKHIAEECKDKYNCSHCYTSRYVLTHYRECKDGDQCQICSPVREEIRRRKQLVGQQQQQQQQQQIMKMTADTFSTSMMTPSSTGITAKVNNVHPPMTTEGGGGGCDGGDGENQKIFPKITVAICPSADNPCGKIIPVRRATSFSSCSSLSHSTAYSALSSRSSVPSSIRSTTASGRTKPYFVKDRENPGIAHFLGKD